MLAGAGGLQAQWALMAAAQPQVYLSVVDEELHTLRDQVAEVLRVMGYGSAFVRHAQLLEQFGRRRGRILRPQLLLDLTRGGALGRSAAMIQLVGHCYGITLQKRSLKHGPLGTLAAEAATATARAVRKPVYYIVLSPAHPVDGGDAATPEMQARHEAYRGRVEALKENVFHSGSVEETLQIVKGLAGPLAQAVKKAGGRQAWMNWLVNLSLICTVLGQFLLTMDKKWEREALEKKWQARYAEGRQRVQAMVAQEILGPEAQRPRWEYEARVRYERKVKPLAWQDNLRESWLRCSIRDDTAEVLGDPGASTQARIDALHRAGFFLPGRDYAAPAFTAPPPSKAGADAEEVLAWIEAAKFGLDCGNCGAATTYVEKALGLVDREHDFLLWSAEQVRGRVLWWQSQPDKALELYHELVALRGAKLGPEHPDTLLSRHELGVVLFHLGRYAESEEELRAVLALQQKGLGPEHADVLRTRMEMAKAAGYQGHYFPAERELREVLRVQERTLGPLHPDSLKCVYEIAFWMDGLGRREGALQYAQKALTGMLQVHGNDHWETVTTRDLVRKLSPGAAHARGALMAEMPDVRAGLR